jgi:hypothetical protein
VAIRKIRLIPRDPIIGRASNSAHERVKAQRREHLPSAAVLG